MSPRARLLKFLIAFAVAAAAGAAAVVILPARGSPADRLGNPPPPASPATPASEAQPASAATAAAGTVVAVVGDIACAPTDPNYNGGKGTRGYCRGADVVARISKIAPDYLLTLGDSQYDRGRLREYKAVYRKLLGSERPITYPTLGNHDYWTGSPKGFFEFFDAKTAADFRGKGWFADEVGGWQFLGLNSNCEFGVGCGRGSAQFKWLKRRLRSSSTTCQVAFYHSSRFASGPHGNDTRMAALFKLLYNNGVDVVASSNDHIYERFAPLAPDGSKDRARGIREFVVGTGGISLYKLDKRAKNSQVVNTKTYGALKMTLSDGAYSWKFVPIKGQSFTDSGSGVCHNS